MRILAIRGENLASLGPAFEIDLATEPLAGTGLFAITGETGAGKSTILDALCLALYGEYPRVDVKLREDVPDPSGKVISASDARAILRRGAGQGYAEVDFSGIDGMTYRARWGVARARARSGGTLQKPQRLLTRLSDSHAIADGIKPVLEAVTAATGLSFEQFRRTVLLAQGEFDRFLLAADNERAELLEKITGTGIYAAIGARIHAGWKERRDAITRLDERRLAIGLMEDAERVALAADAAALETQAGARQAEHHAVAERIALARRLIEARERVAKAQTALEEARARSVAAGPDRVRYALLEAAEPLRGAFEAEANAALQATEAAAAAAQARAELASAETAEQEAQRALEEARAAADALAARQAELEPLWRDAERVDVVAGRAKAEWDKARLAVAEAAKRAGKAAAALRGLSAGNGDDRTAAEASVEIGRLREAEREQAACLEAARARRTALATEIAAREDDLAHLDMPMLRARDEALSTRENLLREASPLVAARAQAATDHALARENAGKACAAIAETERAIEVEQAKHAALTARRTEIASLVALADATQSHEAIRLRETLVPESPCPVCGGLDHPYAHPDHADQGLVAEVRLRRQALDAEIAASEAETQSLRVRRAEAVAVEGQALRTVKAAAQSIDMMVARLRALDDRLAAANPEHIANPELGAARPLDAAPTDAINAALSALAADRRALAAPLARAKTLGDALTAHHKEMQKLASEIDETLHTQSIVAAALEAALREVDWRDHALARAKLLGGEPVAEHRARFATERAATQTRLKSAEDANNDAARRLSVAENRTTETTQLAGRRDRECLEAGQRLATLAQAAALDLEDARALLAEPADRREALGARLDALARDIANAEVALSERQGDLDALLAAGALEGLGSDSGDKAVTADSTSQGEMASLQAAIASLTQTASALHDQISVLRDQRAALNARLAQDDESRRRAAGISAEVEAAKAEHLIWDQVYAAIGDEKGDKFRRFAQGITLEELVHLSNRQLDQLAPRYRLAKSTTSDLALAIIDRDMGDEQRSVRSLSGGERFLMSLALALALSGLEGRQSFVDTLFIDEGFGSLDAETLDIVIEALERLQGSGRKVGVITHVAAMVERIAVQVRVEPRGAGRSIVRIIDRAADTWPLAS